MLVFANTTVANSGEYTCTAISPIGGDAASSVLSVAGKLSMLSETRFFVYFCESGVG